MSSQLLLVADNIIVDYPTDPKRIASFKSLSGTDTQLLSFAMPLLPDLPNELLEQIMKYLLPDDVDNFSDACGDFHNISVRILPRHKELKTTYSKVSWGSCSDTPHRLFLLRDILQDFEIGWYVKIMFIELVEDDFDDHYMEKEFCDIARKISMECEDGIIKTVQACPYLDDGDREKWVKNSLSSQKNTIAALLTCMFPCLESICIIAFEPIRELHVLARKIIQANQLEPGGYHAFSKLQCLQERSYTVDDFREMQLFEPLSGLPSMRRYIGRYLYHKDPWTPPEKKSTITSLKLYECMIHSAALRSAFSGIANLQNFIYEYYWAWEEEALEHSWERDWQPGEIVLSLLEFAGHSLVELDLTRTSSRELQRVESARQRMEGVWAAREEGEDDKNEGVSGIVKPFMGSLREFQVLKYICVQNEAFVEEDLEGSAGGRTVHRVVDLLPASVVSVTLAMPHLSKQESYRLMEGLPELKAERVPKLEFVYFETGKPYREMETVFESDGIELVL